MEAYNECLMSCTFSGPTNFAPVIEATAQRAAQLPPDGSRYCVLLIITDGIIYDMTRTKMAVINVS
jgi:hypothetical protein